MNAAIAIAALLASPSQAATIAASADDICAPADDPCVIESIYEVTGALDFGARKVLIVPGAKLHGKPNVTLTAGEIEIAVGLSADVNIEADGNAYGQISLAATRACSNDGLLRCLADSQCSGGGTCSAGSSGSIFADGMIASSGGSPGGISLRAAGAITLKRHVNVNATLAGVSAGTISVESFQGAVLTSGQLTAASDIGTVDYETGEGGDVEVTAGQDIVIGSVIKTWGDGGGGSVDLTATGNLTLTSDILSDAGEGSFASGGRAKLTAGGDIRLVQAPGGDVTQEISTDGGGAYVFYGQGYQGYDGSRGFWESGYGGYQSLTAGQSIALGPDSILHAQGGPGSFSGYVDLFAYGGDITVEGQVRSQGTPPAYGGDGGASSAPIRMNAYRDVTLSKGSVVDLSSPLGFGRLAVDAGGHVALGGLVDLRATAGDVGHTKSSGVLSVGSYGYPFADTTISGMIRGGGSSYFTPDNWSLDVCRLHVTSTAVLHSFLDASEINGNAIEMSIHESMIADNGSRIETNPANGTQTFLTYRDPQKPPVLNGTISPAPLLYAAPAFDGCPVCGNGEIDKGESCDDGNTVSGDGCRSDCQDEGCIADTPGYPTTALCDDGIPCSEDTCDPVAHHCSNVDSCDDDVACTVDTCTIDGCRHSISDALCNDHNDCTTDICNGATGCVYADLSAISCEDGDFCTAPGTCQHGTCTVAAAAAQTTSNVIQLKVSPGANDDQLKARVELDGHQFAGNPTVSGATLMIGDSFDELVDQVALPAAQWRSWQTGALVHYRYAPLHASTGSIGEVRSVVIVSDTNQGEARTVIRLHHADLAGAANQSRVSLSLMFGSTAGTSPCMTARHIPCRSRGATTTCRD